MKIAVIVDQDYKKLHLFSVHKNKVTHNPSNSFLSAIDKSIIEIANFLKRKDVSIVDAYTFQQDDTGEGLLNEALSLGADSATVIKCNHSNEYSIAESFGTYLKEKEYDLVLVSSGPKLSDIVGFMNHNMNYRVFRNVSKIDPSLRMKITSETGSLEIDSIYPEIIVVSDKLIEPHLPSFYDLNTALQTKKNVLVLKDKSQTKYTSVFEATKVKNKQIFNLEKDPEAVEKLVRSMREDGILN